MIWILCSLRLITEQLTLLIRAAMSRLTFSFLLVAIYLLGIVLGGVPEAGKKPKDEEGKKTSRSADLKTDSSYGLGYGLAYPYYGYGGLGSLRHGLGSVGYGNYGGGYSGYGGKAFILPVYNYGYGGLGYGGYGNPYGYTNIQLGHYGYPYGSAYYSYPFGSSYFGGHSHGYGHGYGAHGKYW